MACAIGETKVDTLTIHIDGRATEMVAERCGAVVWLPAPSFARAVGAELKELAGGLWAVCRGDLCIALEAGDWRAEDSYMALAAVAAPLQLSWKIAGPLLVVTSAEDAEQGLGIGQVPPAFSLPDLYSGELVSSTSFAGRKTFFYLWASW